MLRRLVVGVAACSSASRRAARAQTGITWSKVRSSSLLPTGARAVGMGQAVVASAIGAEALWWNPALIARGPREVAFEYRAAAMALPSRT